MSQENLKKAKEIWKEQGLSIGDSLPEAEIITAFSKIGFSPSKEVIDVYSNFGGFEEDKMDSECLTFWTIEKILKENKSDSEYVFFADFLIESHHYAFKSKDENLAPIYVCYSKNDTSKIADSFDEFFELYLTKPEKLFI